MHFVKNLSPSDFASFGEVLEFAGAGSGFQVKVTELSPTGWRIALLRKENKSIGAIQCHPDSRESFEPVRGVAVLIVARPDRPEEMEAFLLDKPVCLNKGVWHNTLALSEFALIKITENAAVSSLSHDLESELKVALT
jgi:ureidoglycolate hydrolase